VSDKQKNFLVLGLVAVLVAGSLALAVVRDFRLGLDLQGGIEVVLEARPTTSQQVTSQMLSDSADVLRRRVDPNGLLSPEIRTSSSDKQITVAIPGAKDPAEVASLLVATGQLQSFDFYKYLNEASSSGQYTATPSASLWELLNAAKPQVEADQKKGTEPSGWALFDGKTHKQYGAVEPTKDQVQKDLEGKPMPDNPVWLAVPSGTEVITCDATHGCPGATSTEGEFYYLVNLNVDETGNHDVITGDQVSATASSDANTGAPVVSLSYKNGGAQEFTDMTRQLAIDGRIAGGPLPTAYVVDGRLVSLPVVDYNQFPHGIDATLGGGSEITGVTNAEANRIADEIKAGSLPVKFTAVSTTVIGASLGKDALRNGLIAGGIGLIVVMIYLLVLYGFLGLVADLALIIYGILLAGVVLGFNVTMTLPSIAGMILTIGVAADSNIVIFERIKEEVRAGKTIRTAISTGYRRGLHTIIDANVVTLITAVILILSTTSSVKGFAIMLAIGVVVSIFTAVVATRAMLSLLAGFKFMASPRVLGSIGSGNRWRSFDFIGRKKLWFAISAVAITIGVVSLATQGLNKGIDFTGGSRIEFNTQQPEQPSQVSSIVSAAGIPDAQVVPLGRSTDGGYTGFRIQSKTLTQTQQNQLVNGLSEQLHVQATDASIRNVSGSFGASVLRTAYLAFAFSLLVIFIYLSFRFEWRYAVPVMIALAHDLLITLGIYSLVQREVTADTVAAILTVLGYSMYDTVIVFDRVRENAKIHRRMTASRLVNESMAEVLTRSINTTVVTLIPVTLLFFFGGSSSLNDFAFALLVGIASGAYSSIFIAAPLLAVLLEREPTFVHRREEIERTGGREERVAVATATPAAATAGAPPVTAAEPVADKAPRRARRRRTRPHGRSK